MGGTASSFYTGTPVATEPVPVCPSVPAPPSLGGFGGTVTSIGDNASGALERVSTLALPVPSLLTILVNGELQDWLMLVGRNANDKFHQRPNDYADPANVRVWVRQR